MLSSALLRRAAQRSTTRDLSRALLFRNGQPISSLTALNRNQHAAIVSLLRTYATGGRSKTKGTSAPRTRTKTTAKKLAKKTTKKANKPAAKKKKKAPAKKPAKKPKVLTEAQKERKEKRDLLTKKKNLREKALLNAEKVVTKPETAWVVYVSQELKGKNDSPVASSIREVARSFKNLSVAEREAINHQAHRNKAANASAHKTFVESYTPKQIQDANNARKLLNKLAKDSTATRKPKQLKLLKDERRVRAPRTSYIYFYLERRKSGDFDAISIPDGAKRISQEYKALSQSEKNKYVSMAQQDHNRYAREVKSTYGTTVKPSKTAS